MGSRLIPTSVSISPSPLRVGDPITMIVAEHWGETDSPRLIFVHHCGMTSANLGRLPRQALQRGAWKENFLKGGWGIVVILISFFILLFIVVLLPLTESPLRKICIRHW